jgi:hypothetical protein
MPNETARLQTVLDHMASGSMPHPVLAQELEAIMRDISADELERQRVFYAGRRELPEPSSSQR